MQTDLITKVYFNEHLTHSCVGIPQGLQALLSSCITVSSVIWVTHITVSSVIWVTRITISSYGKPV